MDNSNILLKYFCQVNLIKKIPITSGVMLEDNKVTVDSVQGDNRINTGTGGVYAYAVPKSFSSNASVPLFLTLWPLIAQTALGCMVNLFRLFTDFSRLKREPATR